IEADPDQPGAEQGFVLLDRAAVGELAEGAGLFRVLLGDLVEELLRFRGEQRHLFLLDEDGEHGGALARLDHEGARAGLAERARADRVDRVELDGIGHVAGSFASGSGSGTRSPSPPVSLHLTSRAPYGWKSSTVTDAGLTCSRWNRSRCIPV